MHEIFKLSLNPQVSYRVEKEKKKEKGRQTAFFSLKKLFLHPTIIVKAKASEIELQNRLSFQV